jgi:hypothetical protein
MTTNSKHGFPRYANLIKGMLVSRLNQVWLADITLVNNCTKTRFATYCQDVVMVVAAGRAFFCQTNSPEQTPRVRYLRNIAAYK